MKNNDLKKIIKRTLLMKRLCITYAILAILGMIFIICMLLMYSNDTVVAILMGVLCLAHFALLFYAIKYDKLPEQTLINKLDDEFKEGRKITLGWLKVYLTESCLMQYSGAVMLIIERKDIIYMFWEKMPPARYAPTRWKITIETKQKNYALVAHGMYVTDSLVDKFVKETNNHCGQSLD